MYSSAVPKLSQWSKELMEGMPGGRQRGREQMKKAFVISSKYESLFWEMAHTLEEWKY